MNWNLGVCRQYAAAVSGCWLGWPSPAIKMIMQGDANVKITSDQVSWVVALMDFGNLLSPIPSGYMSDCLGRKNTLLLTAFVYLVTWLLTIFGPSFWFLVVARIGAGIGKGVAFTVVPMYLGEIAGVQERGAISTIFTGLLSSGILFEYCVGPFVSYINLNIISGTVPIIFVLTFFLMPDSPYFQLMKNRQKEASKTLAWFRDVDQSDLKMLNELNEMTGIVKKEMSEKGSFLDLVATRGNRRALWIIVFLSAFQRFGGVSPMLAYTVVTLPATGGYFKAEIYMIIFGITLVVGNFLSTPLIDQWGRKPLLIFSCLTCALLTGISTVFYWAAGPQNDLGVFNWIPYASLVLYGITYSMGIGVMPSTFVGELFPTNTMSLAASIGAMSFAIASFSINKVYLVVKESYGVQYMYAFFTICSLCSVVFTILFVFETKGKTFGEIQIKLSQTEDISNS